MKDDQQIKDVIKKIKDGKNLLLTGPAGTGKSTIVKALKDHFGRSLVVTSTTGISALNIGGCTIHSFSGIGIHTKPEAIGLIMNQMNWPKVKRRIQFTRIIVVDEISMMRSDQLELIDEVFKMATGINLPFGGKTMVFVGDFLQLPPVTKQDESLEWIFRSKTWLEAKIEPVHLYTIHRQSDPEFLKHLISLRFGWCNEETDQFFKSRVVSEKDLPSEVLRFFSTNKEAEWYNYKKLQELTSELKTHTADIWAQYESYEKQIKQSVLAEEVLDLKVGARVMFLTNNKIEGSDDFLWVNGSLGTIVRYSYDSPVVEIDESKAHVTVEPYTWKLEDWEGNVLASLTQLPLKLAYGVTIHKSQGLTLDSAAVDCKRIFADGQAYVALSRVRNSSGLYLMNWNPGLVRANQEAVEFYLTSMEIQHEKVQKET